MNAIENNPFSATWRRIGETLTRPRAVVCISAHWLTRGTQVTANERPKTIHDFGGFPRALYEVQYPAPGSPSIAREIQQTLKSTAATMLSEDWGLDHGTWSILVHLHKSADVPVLQLSIDATATAETFVKIGTALRPLRDNGILFIGSGNIVHNLGLVDWNRLNDINFAHDWAREADKIISGLVETKNVKSLSQWNKLPHSVQLAINSAEHYIPLLYIMGLSYPEEKAQFFNQSAVGGALTMTSVRFG